MSAPVIIEHTGKSTLQTIMPAIIMAAVILPMYLMASIADAASKSKDCLATATITDLLAAHGRNVSQVKHW
jgi:hypothetical protein